MNKIEKFEEYIRKLEEKREESELKDFWTGCIAGIKRYVCGDTYISDEEHKKWMASEGDLRRGYVYGIEGVYPSCSKLGRPKNPVISVSVTFRLPKSLADRCQRASFGKVKKSGAFFREAIREKLERDGL